MLINIEKTANFAFLERITSMFSYTWYKPLVQAYHHIAWFTIFSSTYLFQNQNTYIYA